jgi:peptidoglycan/LPS O-acetylase OafA/YrhL
VPDGTVSILTGCLLALKFEWLASKKVFASRLFSYALLGAVALRLYSWNLGYAVHGLGYVINILIALTVFRCVAVPDDIVGKILNSRVLMFVGGLSYSVYVWQQLFLPPTPPGSPFPWNILAVITVALSSFYLVERPCLRLKKRFVRARVERPAKGDAAVLKERLA